MCSTVLQTDIATASHGLWRGALARRAGRKCASRSRGSAVQATLIHPQTARHQGGLAGKAALDFLLVGWYLLYTGWKEFSAFLSIFFEILINIHKTDQSVDYLKHYFKSLTIDGNRTQAVVSTQSDIWLDYWISNIKSIEENEQNKEAFERI